MYLGVKTAIGLSNTFYAVAACCSAGFVYMYWEMPETENKTFAEIEEFFTSNTDQKSAHPEAESTGP